MKQLKSYVGKKVLVLGLAKSGFNAAILLTKLGAEVTANDQQNSSEATQLRNLGLNVITGNNSIEILNQGFDLIVKNPGINYENPLIQVALERQIPIITEPELAYEVSQAPFIGVTGTNGKTTTTTLIRLILDQDRAKGHAYKAGNIGIPVSKVVQEATADDDVVVELSSFQLLGTTKLRPKIAVLTNIYEAHLDYHKTRANYVKAKMKITANQAVTDYFVVNFDKLEWRELSRQTQAQVVPFSRLKKSTAGAYQDGNTLYFRGEPIIDVSEIVLPGQHNLENCLAAIAVAKLLGKSNETIKKVLTTFQGVKHRIQFVQEIHGRRVYNDSKATNIEATIVALQSFEQPIVLIAGGLDRGFNFDELVEPLKRVKAIVLYGETKFLMQTAAKKAEIKTIALVDRLDDAVEQAYQFTNEGDVLLLSPAAASWDQFKTFEERGDRFIEDIEKLK
ncbi:UDP-N-acetylmuramoyl-L-alanine--D-glutamate ligase [Bombilactobacillus folatiphilus]|uniref:UDP-N-acetylmuramoylalanine--D-glutamate ligase n=1 Tax=Bombilactobacillus folatiphilus TaxID=2923362 RepID=A0ABY4PAK7_9LACO|nr:UDP-N-acetylmuramoyl-L-alanine--D-glutamate ligase [Bombilactobacillus folatiphilus]UQS82703.1 UDP-N-acetylmuramoyl-L-alanine--D-glutamate ligase [Bombilactobacillus folatiphilus]